MGLSQLPQLEKSGSNGWLGLHYMPNQVSAEPQWVEVSISMEEKRVLKVKTNFLLSLRVWNSPLWRIYFYMLMVLTGGTCQNLRQGIKYINFQSFLNFLNFIVLHNSELCVSFPVKSSFVCLFSTETHWARRLFAMRKEEMTVTCVDPVSEPCVQFSTLT